MEKISVLASALVLVVAMITAGLLNYGNVILAKSEDSGSGSSSGSSGDKGGSGSSSDSGSDSGSSGGSSDHSSHVPEATPSDNQNNNNNDNPSGSDKGPSDQQNKNTVDQGPVKDNVPIMPNPKPNPVENPGINFGCHFHPNDDRCKPNIPGQCPGGFASNEKGNCHPEGPCPPGFGRHDNDESGQCFHTGPGNFCHFPNCGPCHIGFGFDFHNKCVKKVFIDIEHHNSGSSGSGGSSHSLSAKCFDSIKIAWIGKIHRGENHDVDKIIDKCLGV